MTPSGGEAGAGAIALVNDISRRRRVEEALQESTDRLRRQFKALPIPTYTWQRADGDFVLIDYNDAAVEASKKDVLSYIGAKASSVYRDSPEVLDDFESCFRDRTMVEREMSYTVPRKGDKHAIHVTYVFLPPDVVSVHVQNVIDSSEAQRDLERSVDALRAQEEERQALEARLVRAQEEERTRIAEDIHDDPIQAITAVGFRIASLRKAITDPGQRRDLLKLEESVDHAIDRLRRFLFELRPPLLEREGLAAAVRQYIRRIADQTGADARLEDRMGTQPPPEVGAVAYRIVQEALTNAAKHSGATHVRVMLELREGGVAGEVRDDGIGMDTDEGSSKAPDHIGLSTMRERAEIAGGWCRVQSAPGEGTVVEFWLPLPKGLPV